MDERARPVVTVVGEALVDLVVEPGATDPRGHAGGGPANIAVGLSRLGLEAVLLTSLGQDAYGALVREHLDDNRVRVVDIGAPEAATSTALAHLDAHGAATYTFDLSWDVRALAVAPGSSALHVGSLGLVLHPGDAAVLDVVRRTAAAGEVLVSYDPNCRPTITPDAERVAGRVLEVAPLAHVVKCSDEDLGFLFPGRSPEDLAELLLGLGGATQLVMVTLGGEGALVATTAGSSRVPAYPVPVVDTVGAGDAFMAGILSGLAGLDALSPGGLARLVADGRVAVESLARRAAAVAALTCSRPGADPPNAAELDAFLAGVDPGPQGVAEPGRQPADAPARRAR